KDPVFLHLRQPLSVDDPCGLTCQRKRQDYSIGILQKNRQSTRTYEELDASCRCLLSRIRIDVHSKSSGDPALDPADSAESEYSEHLLSQYGDLAPIFNDTFEVPLRF